MSPKNNLLIQVPEEWVGLRLDKALGMHPEIRSRSRAETLISSGRVRLGSKVLKSSEKVQAGWSLEVDLPPETPTELIPLDRPLEVFFEDEDLIVLNKPAGLVVHPAAGHAQDTLVNMLIAHTDDLSMGFDENRPGIVHRLDRDTSGLLVVAKNDVAHRALAEAFQKRDLHRVYHAICVGIPPKKTGVIQSYLARHPQDRKSFASVQDSNRQILRDPLDPPSIGKWAVTNFEVLDQLASGVSYLRLRLETGRTHQIRVHLSELGCPIAADEIYLAPRRLKGIQNSSVRQMIAEFPRLALHARELGFKHPRTGEFLSFKANWPSDLSGEIAKLNFPKWLEILKA